MENCKVSSGCAHADETVNAIDAADAAGHLCVGSCKVCEQGMLGVRVCSGSHRPIVLCDECESVWEDPSCSSAPQSTKNPGSLCPICQQPVFGSTTHWADRNEITQLGWKEYVSCSDTAKDD